MVFCRIEPLTSRKTAKVKIMRTVITRKSQPVIRNVMEFLIFTFKLIPSSVHISRKAQPMRAP